MKAKLQEQHMKQQQRMSIMRPLPTPNGQSQDVNTSVYAVPASLIRGQQAQPENQEVAKLVCYHGNLARYLS